MSQIERLYWLDAQIRANRYPNADTLREEFGISRRRAFDDKKYLAERLSAPVEFDPARRGWTYTDPTFVLPALSFSDREALALARSLLTGRAYVGEIDSIMAAEVARRLSEYAPLLKDRSWMTASGALPPATNVGVSAALLQECEEAIPRRQKLRVRYYSAHRDSTDERTIHPYHLHNFQGEWHLMAWCEWRQEIRQFYLGRVREWRRLLTEGAYAIDKSFDAREYLKQGFGARHGEDLVTVRVRFSAHQARWVRERVYHST